MTDKTDFKLRSITTYKRETSGKDKKVNSTKIS